MVVKDPSCLGCPGHDWPGFVSPSGTGRNGVMLCGEAPGEEEALKGRPFVGRSGFAFQQMLQRRGWDREDFIITNTIRSRPPDNKLRGTPYEHAVIDHCSHFLDETIAHYKPKCIVAMGEIAMRRLTGLYGITKNRGYVEWSPRYNTWIIGTFHPAYLMRGNQRLVQVFLYDIAHALEIARDGYEHWRPDLVLDPSAVGAEVWAAGYEAALAADPTLPLAYDIETPYKLADTDEGELEADDESYVIVRIGFSYGASTISVPWGASYLPFIQRVLGSAGRKISWNGSGYDDVRIRAAGVALLGQNIDAMWGWHVLNSDLERGLAMVAPFYVPQQPRWKHTSSGEPAKYNAIDALVQWHAGMGIERDLKKQGLWDVFDRRIIRLDPPLKMMEQAGMLIDVKARAALSADTIVELDKARDAVQTVVPLAAKRLKTYLKPPKPAVKAVGTWTTIEKLRPVKVCAKCGAIGVTKGTHTSKASHACRGAVILIEERIVTLEARVEPFVPSNVQMQTYCKVQGHKPVLNYKTKKPTFDEDALKQLMLRHRTDELYPLVLQYREMETLLTRYVGQAEGAQWRGGMPLGPDGRVHTTYCLTGDHEVLTPDGWVRFDQLENGTKVAQWNEGQLWFVQPSEVVRADYQGDLIRLAGPRISLTATPTHRVGYYYDSAKNGITRRRWKVQAAASLPQRPLIPCTGELPGEGDEWVGLQLALAVQADGSVRSGSYRVGVKKVRKIERMRQLLHDADLSWREAPRANGTVNFTFKQDPSITRWFRDGEKKILDLPRLLALPLPGKHCLLTEVLEWDGSRGGGAYQVYITTVRENAEAVQTIAHVSGLVASLKERRTVSGRKPCYVVTLSWADALSIPTARSVIHGFVGKVYCVSVPSEFFLVRKDGNISVTGNTHAPSTLRLSSRAPNLQNIPRGTGSALGARVKQMFIADPGCLLVECDYSAIEAVLVGYFANSPSYMRLAKLGVHDYFNSHVLTRQGKIARPADLSWSDSDLKEFFGDLKVRFDYEREGAKRTVHMSNYGGTPTRMVEANPELFATTREAGVLQDMYFEVCPEVKRWQEEEIIRADKEGFIRNPFRWLHRFWGARKWTKIAGIWEPKWGDDAKRVLAFRPQSTAAAIICDVIVRLYEEHLHTVMAYLRLQVHDSLVCNVPTGYVEEFLGRLIAEMTRPIPELPLDPSFGMGSHLAIGVEAKAGMNWGSMKKQTIVMGVAA